MIKIKGGGGFFVQPPIALRSARESDAMNEEEQPQSVSKLKEAYLQLAVAMQAKNKSISAKLLAEAMFRAAVDLMSDAAGRTEAVRMIRGVADELDCGEKTTGKTC